MAIIKMTFAGATALIGAAAFCVPALAQDSTGNRNVGTTVVTNDSGTVTKTYTESNVSTNGNMFTKRVRITMTTLDPNGNILGTSTTETSESKSSDARYWADENGLFFTGSVRPMDVAWLVLDANDINQLRKGKTEKVKQLDRPNPVAFGKRDGDSRNPKREAVQRKTKLPLESRAKQNPERVRDAKHADAEEKTPDNADETPDRVAKHVSDFSFLGVKLGSTLEEAGLKTKAPQRRFFKRYLEPLQLDNPPRTLNGFDDYSVYVTPKTKKIYAYRVAATIGGNKNVTAIDYNYILEALKQKYGEPFYCKLVHKELDRPQRYMLHKHFDLVNLPDACWIFFGDDGSSSPIFVTLDFREHECHAIIKVEDKQLGALAQNEVNDIKRAEKNEDRKRIEDAAKAF